MDIVCSDMDSGCNKGEQMEFLESSGSVRLPNEEVIDRVGQCLQDEDGVGDSALLLYPIENICYVHSDSAYSLTSSSSRLSNPEDLSSSMECRCGCAETGANDDGVLEYLLGASDEELGIPPSSALDIAMNPLDVETELEGLERIDQSCFCFNGVLDLELWQAGDDDQYL